MNNIYIATHTYEFSHFVLKRSNMKWPCCDKCSVKVYTNYNSSINFYRIIGCKKCKNIKDIMYTKDEFNKMLRYRNYLIDNNQKSIIFVQNDKLSDSCKNKKEKKNIKKNKKNNKKEENKIDNFLKIIDDIIKVKDVD